MGSDNVRASLKAISITESSATNSGVQKYSALSYTWGLDTQLRSTIYLDNRPFEVRENLLKALQKLRDHDACRYLWIDAICISQDDMEEKRMQIPLMGLIYSKAETVEIWLGTGEPDGELGLQALSSRELPDIATPDSILAIANLVERPWFTRVWIIQELLLSAKDTAFVRCGDVRVAWDAFASGITRL
ncbi:heterokaryon incompatibility protein-domain-containing protein, partial [Rhexocercosporidium sp. MPI-PUGE-AT-0058]